MPTVVICAYEGRCALRLAHASNPENTIDEQAVNPAIAWNKSFGAPPLYASGPDEGRSMEHEAIVGKFHMR